MCLRILEDIGQLCDDLSVTCSCLWSCTADYVKVLFTSVPTLPATLAKVACVMNMYLGLQVDGLCKSFVSLFLSRVLPGGGITGQDSVL